MKKCWLALLLVLVLATFAALSLSTAQNDRRLSASLADHRTQYYGACSEAEYFIAYIDEQLAGQSEGSAEEQTGPAADFSEKISAYAQSLNDSLKQEAVSGADTLDTNTSGSGTSEADSADAGASGTGSSAELPRPEGYLLTYNSRYCSSCKGSSGSGFFS